MRIHQLGIFILQRLCTDNRQVILLENYITIFRKGTNIIHLHYKVHNMILLTSSLNCELVVSITDEVANVVTEIPLTQPLPPSSCSCYTLSFTFSFSERFTVA